MITLILATRNAHKRAEIQNILGEKFNYLSLEDLSGAPTVIEDAPTFAGNATKKAVTLANWVSHSSSGIERLTNRSFVLADDSGLEVDALKGAPGVYSARFAALDSGIPGNSSDSANSQKLLELLRGIPLEKRTARFRCVLALTPITNPITQSASPVCYTDELEFGTDLFEGTCEGHIGLTSSGRAGFGYDPLFVPSGFKVTFAEMSEEKKNRLSHRALAVERVKLRLLAQSPV